MTAKKLIRPLEYVLIVTTILECSSQYLEKFQIPFVTDMSVFLYGVAITFLVLDVLLHFIAFPVNVKKGIFYIIPIAILEVYALVFYFVNVTYTTIAWIRLDFIKNFMIIMPLFMIIMWFKAHIGRPFDLFYKHSDIVSVYCLFNLMVYLSGILNGASMPSDVIYSKWSTNMFSVNFYNIVTIHNGTAWQIADIPLLRNYGVFVEPLLFSVQLVTALFTELFVRSDTDKLKLYKAILISLTLLSSQTTMGMMIMSLAWGMKAVEFSIVRNKKFYILPAIILVIGLVAFLFYEKSAMRYDISDGGSIYTHIQDFKIGIKAFLNKPLFGGGYQNNTYVNEFTPIEEGPRGFSNSIAIVLGQGGIMLGLLCTAPFIIVLFNIFKKGKRNMALWAVGPFGVYVVTLLHYHVFLMMLIAFGLSQIPVFVPKKIAENDRNSNDNEFNLENDADGFTCPWTKVPVFVVVPVYIALTALMVLFGSPIWNGLYHVLRTHQWSMAQSVIKAFFLCLVITLNLVAFSDSIKYRDRGANAISIIISDAIYLIFYNYIQSALDTYLSIKNCWTGVLEGVLLFAFFIVLYGLMYYSVSSVYKAKKDIDYLLAFSPPFIILIIFVGFFSLMIQDIYLVDGFLDDVDPVVECAEGKVYSIDRPYLFHAMQNKITYAGTRDDGFDTCKDTTVIFKKDNIYNFPKMFEAGFLLTQLSDDLMAYSNDSSVVNGLRGQGYEWFRYYPYEQAMDMQYLAKINGLKLDEDGQTVFVGKGKAVNNNAGAVYQKGKYTLTSHLKIDRNEYGEVSDDTVISTVKVIRMDEKEDTVINARDIKLSDFDEEGNFEAQIPFSVNAISRLYRYRIDAKGDFEVKISGISLYETPDYITVERTDVYGNILREEYYHNDSTPYEMSAGYCAIERDYDLRGRAHELRYFDGEGKRTLISSGYSSIKYSYNRKGSVIKEEYYDIEDKPQNLVSGYSKIEYEYDDHGNRSVIKYLDSDGNPVLIKSDYAILKRTFKGNLAVLEEYYDTEGNPTYNSSGVAAVEREYDENDRVICEQYFGIDGNPIANTLGFFEVRYERDGQGRVVLESYYDDEGRKISCTGGYFAVATERDTYGNAVRTVYLDEDNNPVLNTSRIAVIAREFSNENYAIKETYYDAEGNITLNSAGIAGILREYDTLKRNYKDTYIDEEGKVKLNTSGIACVVREYDDRNRNVRESYLDENGKAILNTSGAGQILRDYDEYNMTVRYSYADTEGNITAISSAIASIVYTYDEHWINVKEEYFDAGDNPVMNTSLYAGIRRTYENKMMTHEEYFDTEGNVTAISNGTYGQNREYDKYRNLTKIIYVDDKGNPMLNTSGYAITVREFDAARNCTAEYFYDEQGNPVNNTSGVHEIHRVYDRERNATETTRFDVDGNQI